MGNITISVGIACVPERISSAAKIVTDLMRYIPVQMVTVFQDVHHRGSWYGHKGAMQAKHEKATHHLVLEDDAVLCENFIPVLMKCLEAVPDQVVSLFATRTHMAKTLWAVKHGYSWYCDKYGGSGVALVMPVPLLDEFLVWERRCPPAMPYEDSRLWGWMYETERYTWHQTPHLCDHGMPTNSTMGFNSAGKVAGDFLGDTDGLAIDWTKGVQELRENPRPKIYKWGEDDYMKWVGKHRRTD